MTNRVISDDSAMKRYNRMTPSNLCIMPRKVIAWIIMSMALMSMVSLMVIEVRRIMAMRGLLKPGPLHRTSGLYFHEDNLPKEPHEVHFRGLNQELGDEITHLLQAKKPWNDADNMKNNTDDDSDRIEALFEDHPHCRERPYLLILVTSGPENFERREAIRKSWAHPEGWKLHVSGLKSKILFLIGKSTTKFLNILLKNENDIAGDILLGKYCFSIIHTYALVVIMKGTVSQKNKPKNPYLFQYKLSYRNELVPIIMDYCLLPFNALHFFLRAVYVGDLYLTLFFSMQASKIFNDIVKFTSQIASK